MRFRPGPIAVLVVVAVSGAGCSRDAAPSRAQRQPLPPLPAALKVYVDEQKGNDAHVLQLHRSMAKVLDGYAAIPDLRLKYWSAVNNANDYRITGWYGYISGVQPSANGHLVTIRVAPMLDSKGRCLICVIQDTNYSEQYQVNDDGDFAYVGSLDPQGLAGKMPDIAGV